MHHLFGYYDGLVLQIVGKQAFHQEDDHWPAEEVERADYCQLFDEEDDEARRLVQGGADADDEDKEEEDPQSKHDNACEGVVMMLKLLPFLRKGQHQADDVDSSDQQPQANEELAGLEVHDRPAPRNHDEESSDERLSDVLQHHVQDLEEVDPQPIEAEEDYVDEAVQVGRAQHDQPSEDGNLQPVGPLHGQQVANRVSVAEDKVAPKQHDHYICEEQASALPEVASVVGNAESHPNLLAACC